MHSTKETLKLTYNKIAPHFNRTRQLPWQKVTDFIKNQPKQTLILDLGAGTGRHSVEAKKNDLYPIAGDFSISQLMELKKTDKTIPCILMDLEHLPFRDDSLDSIMYIAAIHHLDKESARIDSLKECRRILKPGSQMVTSVWSLDQPRFIGKADKNGDIEYTWDKKYPRFYHLFKEDELEAIHKKAGLETIESEKVNCNYYCFSRNTLKSGTSTT